MNQIHEDSNIGLTMEDKMVALLKWLGWRRLSACAGQVEWWGRWVEGNPNPIETSTHAPPLTLDLMFEAEEKYLKSCTCVDQKSLWLDILACEVGWVNSNNPTDAQFECDLNSAHATKEQRLEALLKTIGTA